MPSAISQVRCIVARRREMERAMDIPWREYGWAGVAFQALSALEVPVEFVEGMMSIQASPHNGQPVNASVMFHCLRVPDEHGQMHLFDLCGNSGVDQVVQAMLKQRNALPVPGATAQLRAGSPPNFRSWPPAEQAIAREMFEQLRDALVQQLGSSLEDATPQAPVRPSPRL